MTTPADIDALILQLRVIQSDWTKDRDKVLSLTSDLTAEKVRSAGLSEALAASEARNDALEDALAACLDAQEPTVPRWGIRKPTTKVERGTNGVWRATASATFESVRFECWVERAANITLQFNDCEFVGPPGVLPVGTGKPLVKHFGTGTGRSTFNYCSFYQPVPSPSAPITGIKGSKFTVSHCDFHHLSDMMHTHVDSSSVAATVPIDVTVDDCWLHDFVWWKVDHHADGTHTDGIQNSYGGRGLVVKGGRFDLYLADDAGDPRADRRAMSGMMLADGPSSGGVLDMDCVGTEFNGGQVCWNFAMWGSDKTNLPTGTRELVDIKYGPDVTVGALAKIDLPLVMTGGTGGAPTFVERKRG